MLKNNQRKVNIRLTSQDIASYCQVSKSTVLTWIKNDKLKAFSLPSGHYRIDRKDFVDFLDKWHMPVQEWLLGEGNGDPRSPIPMKGIVRQKADVNA